MHVSVLIDTKLYLCLIRGYGIEYLSSACLLARAGHALVVHLKKSNNIALGVENTADDLMSYIFFCAANKGYLPR